MLAPYLIVSSGVGSWCVGGVGSWWWWVSGLVVVVTAVLWLILMMVTSLLLLLLLVAYQRCVVAWTKWYSAAQRGRNVDNIDTSIARGITSSDRLQRNGRGYAAVMVGWWVSGVVF